MCPECGRRPDGVDARFCGRCGASLAPPSEGGGILLREADPPSAGPEGEKQPRRGPIAALTGLVVALAVVGAVVVAGQPEDPADTPLAEAVPSPAPAADPTPDPTPDPADRLRPSHPRVSFEPEDGHVFAQGETADGWPWTAAVATGPLGEPPREQGICLGIRLELEGGVSIHRSCAPLGAQVLDVRTSGETQLGTDGLGMVGWVSDEVARVVWRLADSEVELDVRAHADVPGAVFALFSDDPPSGRTAVVAYDDGGRTLGAVAVPRR